jgi:hypothetical protein
MPSHTHTSDPPMSQAWAATTIGRHRGSMGYGAPMAGTGTHAPVASHTVHAGHGFWQHLFGVAMLGSLSSQWLVLHWWLLVHAWPLSSVGWHVPAPTPSQ